MVTVLDSRRRFLKSTAALCVPLVGLSSPRVWGAVRELPALEEVKFDRSEPGLARAALLAAPASVNIDGKLVKAITYNNAFPGPLMRWREGETVQLKLINRLDRDTNLHFHGVSLPPTGRADNIWLHVPPGDTFDYEFTVPKGEGGLHWYHPHINGATAQPMFAGLAGPILIEGDYEFERELDCDDRVCVLKDISLEGGKVQPHRASEWTVGKEGELLLINGVSRPTIRAKKSLVRLRLLNASNARYWRLRFSDDRPMIVLAHDGRYLRAPQPVDEVLLVPGARAEILVELSDGRPVDVVYHPTGRRGMAYTATQSIMTLAPPSVLTATRMPSHLVSYDPFRIAEAQADREVVLGLFNICTRFLEEARVDIRTQVNAKEIWRVRNADFMDHPFHLHTWHYEILDINGQPPPYSARYDMTNVRVGFTVRIGIHFKQHTGRTMYHCHLAEHSDKGMMAVLEVV